MSSIARIQLRRDTAAAWTAANPVLLIGEIGIETDTLRCKVGDSASAWNALPYAFSGSSAPMVRGQASKMDTGTIDIASQGAYVTTGLTATFDANTANGMALATVNAFGLKNTSGVTKLLRFFGSIDARTVTGNNQTLGVKLAYNGVAIDETECRAFTGTGTEEAKLVTSWMISVANNDEVSLFIANHSGSGNISFRRGRLLASEVL
jgi:hypothetical protein